MSRPPRPARHRRHEAGESICAWCERVIPEGREVLGVGAKALPGVDLRRHQGRVTRLHLVTANRSVRAMVTGADSPARREGHDLYFMVCGEACGAALRAALAEDIRIGRVARS